MISEIVHEASCPVIALLEADDPVWVNEAAKRGIFAYIVDGRAEEMQSAIDITLRRYAEYASLEGAFARRAVIERAKGIMMSRQEIDERRAFELLRSQSQRSGRKLYDVAEAVLESHLLLVQPERGSEKRVASALQAVGLNWLPESERHSASASGSGLAGL